MLHVSDAVNLIDVKSAGLNEVHDDILRAVMQKGHGVAAMPFIEEISFLVALIGDCLLYTSPSPRDPE